MGGGIEGDSCQIDLNILQTQFSHLYRCQSQTEVRKRICYSICSFYPRHLCLQYVICIYEGNLEM